MSRTGVRRAAGSPAREAAATAQSQAPPRPAAATVGRVQVDAASTTAVKARAGSSQEIAVQDRLGTSSVVRTASGNDVARTAAVLSRSSRAAGWGTARPASYAGSTSG